MLKFYLKKRTKHIMFFQKNITHRKYFFQIRLVYHNETFFHLFRTKTNKNSKITFASFQKLKFVKFFLIQIEIYRNS